jgi:hypothetical protein
LPIADYLGGSFRPEADVDLRLVKHGVPMRCGPFYLRITMGKLNVECIYNASSNLAATV